MGSSSRGRSSAKENPSKAVPGNQSAHRAQKSVQDPPPSRDGRAQRAAQNVEGLKGYQLGDCVGKGAFGSVYRALHWGSGETVAIKQVRLADLPKTDLREIMLEIDLLKNLHHPNIVKYHGFVKSTDSLYIILEYCENGSLHSICKNFGKFPENLVVLYLSQVLHGLLYLHDQGVIHRDIKGANILTTKEGLVKLADFGVATRTQGLHESKVVGTPYWMAPEVIELSGATTASDIWSLGCTVIELLDGKPPYDKLDPMPAMFRIVTDDHPPIPEGASPVCRDFLMQCFQKDPNLRVSAKKLLKHPWIVSAKKAGSVVPTKPTQFDQAVKSVQEWNEALRSPNSTGRKVSRHSPALRRNVSTQRNAGPAGKPEALKPKAPSPPLVLPSIEAESDDNWDSDFSASFGSDALNLSHLKPQDNFDGQLSHEKLKSYASFDRGDATTLSITSSSSHRPIGLSLNLDNTDPLSTMRLCPPTVRKLQSFSESTTHPQSPQKSSLPETASKSDTSYQPGPSFTSLGSQPLTRPTNLFQETPDEDFSDLGIEHDIPTVSFQRLQLGDVPSSDPFSLKFGNPSVPLAQTLPSTARPEPPMRLSRPLIEINKYTETDDDDFSDVFGVENAILPPQGLDGGSQRSTGITNLLLPPSKILSNSWLGDDEDDDDPFAQLEEGFDEMDLETQVARDRFARLCTSVESLVGSLKTTQTDDVLSDVSEQLLGQLLESLDLKSVIISSHGMLPILEILENCVRREVVLRLLKIVNIIITDNIEIQENLCFVGGIPIVSQFALKKYPREIRLEAASFVRQMYQTSTLTLQMFISCGGLNVLVEFLEEDLDTERELVLIGVNGVWSVFELQGPTPKNDFCRILSRSTILYPLSLVLNRLLCEGNDVSDLIQGRIVNIFLLFSQAENHVKETIADRMVLKRVLKDLPRMSHLHQITMLKFIKNLSMLATTHDALQNSNAIEILTDFLSSSMKWPHFREISNQVLNVMYNLCRLSKVRQEDAALNGIIPLLQKIVQTEWPLKEFALPILCDMAHSGKVGRKLLWQSKGLHFYTSLLADKYWQVTALDAIFVWLQEETARVEQYLLEEPFGHAIVDCFINPEASADAFENLLEPLQKLLRLSPALAGHLAHPEVFTRTAQKLHTKKAVVRVNLLRIVRSICDVVPFITVEHSSDHARSQPSTPRTGTDFYESITKAYGLYDAVVHLSEFDPAVLVREMALDIIKIGESQPTVGVPENMGNLPAHSGGRILSRQGTVTRQPSTFSIAGLNSSPPLAQTLTRLSKPDRGSRVSVLSAFDSKHRSDSRMDRRIDLRSDGGGGGVDPHLNSSRSSTPGPRPASNFPSFHGTPNGPKPLGRDESIFPRTNFQARLGNSVNTSGLAGSLHGSDGSGSSSSRESGNSITSGLLFPSKGKLSHTPGRFPRVVLNSSGTSSLFREPSTTRNDAFDENTTPAATAPAQGPLRRPKGLVLKNRGKPENWK